MTKSKEDKSSTTQINPGDLDRAIRRLFDTFDRLMCPIFLLGQTARDVKDAPLNLDGGLLTGDKITAGVHRKSLTKEVWSTLRTIEKVEEDGNLIKFEHLGVPIEVKIIDKKWKFLNNLDNKPYLVDDFLLPNPFEAYWKARGLVR